MELQFGEVELSTMQSSSRLMITGSGGKWLIMIMMMETVDSVRECVHTHACRKNTLPKYMYPPVQPGITSFFLFFFYLSSRSKTIWFQLFKFSKIKGVGYGSRSPAE